MRRAETSEDDNNNSCAHGITGIEIVCEPKKVVRVLIRRASWLHVIARQKEMVQFLKKGHLKAFLCIFQMK